MGFLGDRRKHSRFPINLPVYIFHSEKRAVAHTLDLGLGGMKIHTDQVLPSRREPLFQLVLGEKVIWVKGRSIFAQTQPDLVNFSCIQFVETPKESQFILHEYLSGLEKQLKKERLELEERIREREAGLAKANELLKVENERWKGGEQILKELEERFRYLSSKFLDRQETKIKSAVKELHGKIEDMILAILENILIRVKKGDISDHFTFEQIIFNIQSNYNEIRKILENLWPSLSEELAIISTIRWHCQELQKMYGRLQNEKESDLREEARSAIGHPTPAGRRLMGEEIK